MLHIKKKHRVSKILAIGLLPFYFWWQFTVIFEESRHSMMKITYYQ